ncbi:carboxypeptidase-like regulatory domain-containing protein [Winogradskyella psychrotolerans]|uniref:carboxypeptidase-like regulatory domain-containing protein n=1 Tax=Winogradskyella psychrotolerans TaxID=1344585 RepID=UPI001C075CF7|nr:carboxypeptidase-like regulatory domain-containing protein [Winogradskyella psychrotolerans]MBU2929183.1 carboxypeptidase-like regulatory domain-containing protein [Winogradskyella psychrotolerans]
MKNSTLVLIALSLSFFASAQISVTGTVANDSIPLASASVIIKNSANGIATNEKGEFKLEAKKGDTLSVSYLGYKTKNLVLDKPGEIDVKLQEDIFDEVVVVGYRTMMRTMSCCGGFRVCLSHLNNKSGNSNKLFPNPSSNGIFQLKLLEDYDEVKISIANSSGQIIQNLTHQKFGEKITIDVSQFVAGIYIVSIIADGKQLESIKAIKS